MAVSLWGKEKAFLPFTQQGAMKDDPALSIPFFVDTGHKDSYGQHIFYFNFRQHDSPRNDGKAMARAAWYVLQTRLEEDEQLQTNGVVFLCHCVRNVLQWNASVTKHQTDALRKAVPVRLAAMHFCDPPHSLNVMFRLGKIFMGELGTRMKIHRGTQEEILASLDSFGMSKNVVPTQLGGSVTLDHDQWIRERLVAEETQ